MSRTATHQANGAGQGVEDSTQLGQRRDQTVVIDCAKDAWVSKMDKTRMYLYQMAKQL